MRGIKILMTLMVLAVSGISVQANASVTAYISARESNSFGIKGDWDSDGVKLNHQDCVDNIEITVTISVSSSEDTDGRELYIFAGSSCDDSDDTSDCDDDVLSFDADETKITLDVAFLIDADDCSDSDSSSIWVGLLDSADEKDDNATWATAIDVDFEGGLPSGVNSKP